MNLESLPIALNHIQAFLAQDTTQLSRIFHGRGQFYPGLEHLTVDWMDGQLLVSLFREVDEEFLSTLIAGLKSIAQSDDWQKHQGLCIILQYRHAEWGDDVQVVVGEPNWQPIVDENGLSFALQLGKNQNTGLFLDMANGRQWVREQANNARVLNLFSYTCGFSVAAIAGGAEHVVNVDMSRSSLAKGKENHRLNEHDTSKVSFFAHDILKSWGKIRKNGPYDLIIIDPPSFQKGSFALSKDYQKVVRRLPELLTDGAQVLACVNSPQATSQFLIDLMSEHAPELKYIERLDNPKAFVDKDVQASLKALVFRKG